MTVVLIVQMSSQNSLKLTEPGTTEILLSCRIKKGTTLNECP